MNNLTRKSRTQAFRYCTFKQLKISCIFVYCLLLTVFSENRLFSFSGFGQIGASAFQIRFFANLYFSAKKSMITFRHEWFNDCNKFSRMKSRSDFSHFVKSLWSWSHRPPIRWSKKDRAKRQNPFWLNCQLYASFARGVFKKGSGVFLGQKARRAKLIRSLFVGGQVDNTWPSGWSARCPFNHGFGDWAWLAWWQAGICSNMCLMDLELWKRSLVLIGSVWRFLLKFCGCAFLSANLSALIHNRIGLNQYKYSVIFARYD